MRKYHLMELLMQNTFIGSLEHKMTSLFCLAKTALHAKFLVYYIGSRNKFGRSLWLLVRRFKRKFTIFWMSILLRKSIVYYCFVVLLHQFWYNYYVSIYREVADQIICFLQFVCSFTFMSLTLGYNILHIMEISEESMSSSDHLLLNEHLYFVF